MPRAIYLLPKAYYEAIYGPEERRDIAELLGERSPHVEPSAWGDEPERNLSVEIILSGWGMVPLRPDVLSAFPRLRAVLYGAGSIRGFSTDEAWDRGVRITSAYGANAVPVSEFALAQILLSLKRAWPLSLGIRQAGRYPPGSERQSIGAYGSTVGLLSLGMIGRLVVQRLRPFDLRVIAYDPFVSEDEARSLGVEVVSLDDVFRRAAVVSCHTPWLKETEGMIQGRHFELMRDGATFINTARGAVVDEAGMIDVLRRRPDLTALLDVTHPEPPAPGSPLYTLPNVVLTPHIAGSSGLECRRMGRFMVDELRRHLAGEPFRWEISRERAAFMA